MQRKPDHTFTVRVCPVVYVHRCAARRAEESRGLYGFHDSRCPDCRIEHAGFEMWGQNGHCQAEVNSVDAMRYWIARKAREQWRRDGALWGYRFERGAEMRYIGS